MAKDNSEPISFITTKYPTYRDDLMNRDVYRWLDGKRIDDEAEGLWRIHDHLYDLNEFIDRHPGGAEWLQLTKGTDITEAFETHHISTAAELLLPKFAVRSARIPRNIKITFHEDGFYRTLKRRVRQLMPTIDKSSQSKSKLIFDSLLLVTLSCAILSTHLTSVYFVVLSSASLSLFVTSAHNFLHQKDNWRMYLFNLSLMSYREWRIMHGLSHHLYPNSVLDLEVSLYEPFLCWLPNQKIKNKFNRYASWVYGPFLYFFAFKTQFLFRISSSLRSGNKFRKDDCIPFILPLLMYSFGNADFYIILKYWIFIIGLGSFWFELISLNAAHHHDSQWHDGDILSSENIDFGVYQLCTVMDRSEIKGSLFCTLTQFGDHVLHHMFPTLDHAVLPQLYSTLYDTCREFKAEYCESTWYNNIKGQQRQLARITKVDQTKKLL